MRTVRTDDSQGYSAEAWKAGPERVYAQMAEEIVGGIPSVDGARALDLGAGTGAAGAVLMRHGALVTALDIAPDMFACDTPARPRRVVGDALALPFRDGCFDVVVAAFSLNHLYDPAGGMKEACRTTRYGGRVVVTAYASVDDHPVKAAVATAAFELGWTPASAMNDIRLGAMPKLQTVQRAAAKLRVAGLEGTPELVRIAVPELDADDLIAWRLGMADIALFVSQLSVDERRRLCRRALDLLGPQPPPLVRSVIVITIVA